MPFSALPGIGDLVEDDFQYYLPGEAQEIFDQQLL